MKIGQAYDVLYDPTSRRTYDRELATGNLFSSFGAGEGSSSGATYGGGFGGGSSGTNHGGGDSGDDAKTYESYRQAFDDRMANLSPEELNAIKSVASIVGSLVGSVYGQRLASKVTGKSRLGRALGETAGSLVGSLVGSEAGTNFISSVHESSVERVTYEEERKMARDRGQPMPERREKDSDSWNDLKHTFDQTINSMKMQKEQQRGETRNRSNNSSSENHRDSGRDGSQNSNDWVGTGMSILGVMADMAAANKNSQTGRQRH